MKNALSSSKLDIHECLSLLVKPSAMRNHDAGTFVVKLDGSILSIVLVWREIGNTAFDCIDIRHSLPMRATLGKLPSNVSTMAGTGTRIILHSRD